MFVGSLKWHSACIPMNFKHKLFGFGLADGILLHISRTVELQLHLGESLEFVGLESVVIP